MVDLPHTTRKGTMGFLQVVRAAGGSVLGESSDQQGGAAPPGEVVQGPGVACLQPARVHQRGGLQGSALGDGEALI